jgi:hypothetical protein
VSDTTKAGRIFIREATILPESLQFESEPYVSDWRLVKNLDGHGLGRQIQETGWTFFCLAGEIRAIVFGRETPEGIRRAIRRILTKLKSEKFNSLEITGVVSKRFLGVPYVTVSARSRHIQESAVLFQNKGLPKWDRAMRAAA